MNSRVAPAHGAGLRPPHPPGAADTPVRPPPRLNALRAMPSQHGQPPRSATLLIPNRRDAIDRAEEEILGALEAQGYTETSRFAVRLALEEALSNAFHHGHRGLP